MKTLKEAVGVGADVALDRMANVVLYNDDVNTFAHVIKSVSKIFGYTVEEAERIAMEAHNFGRAIAKTEGRQEAITHKGQLSSCGLTSEVMIL